MSTPPRTRQRWSVRAAGLVIGATLFVVATACSAGSGDSRAAIPTAPPAIAVWTSCGEGLECTSLTVPVDWTNPEGATIDLAVIRRPASGPSIGPLLVNPGGPGASGVEWLRGTSVFDELNTSFDIVSWDPRGVGDSTRLDCGGVGGTNGADVHKASPIGPDAATNLALVVEMSQACALGSPELVANLGTDQTVGDMEAIRMAMGASQISYLGFSYGTYLGLSYSERFGPQVRAMVLDGVVDPALDLQQLLAAQLEGMEPLLDAIASTPAGGNLFDVAADTEGVDPAVLSFAAIAASYDPSSHQRLRQALIDAIEGDSTGLRSLADGYWSAASFTAYLGTLCADLNRPRDAAGYQDMVDALTTVAPRLGPAVAGEVAGCAWWPGPPGTSDPAAVGVGAPPILVVGATGDVATPLALAESVDAALGTSALVVHESGSHTSFGRSTCVDTAVINYLVSLTLPADPTVCSI